MQKFMMIFNYSSGSWARMLSVTDDRASAVATLVECLGGKMECMYWEVEDAAVYVICDLPDSLTAAAAITAATRTGGFKDVQARELLSQDQLQSVVTLAKNTTGFFHPPGAAAIDDMVSG